MSDSANNIQVRHNEAETRFETTVEGQLSVVEYELNDRAMVLTHTFVPPELRGRGIAEKLVRAALTQAAENAMHVVPACSYVAAFIRRHPEFQPLVA
jgi:uncharacterized protein